MKRLAKNWKLLFAACFIFGLVGCAVEPVKILSSMEIEETMERCIAKDWNIMLVKNNYVVIQVYCLPNQEAGYIRILKEEYEKDR